MISSFRKDNLRVQVYPTRREMGSNAARNVAETIHTLLAYQPEVNMIFAAAPSQNEFLETLSATGHIDWHRINAFQMDEYIGLPVDASQRFGNFLKERIFDKLPFRTVNYLDGNCRYPKEECERYTALLQQHPVDIVCMGIGENGHIAFNDPHVARFNDPEWVKVIDLDETCRKQQVNDGCFNSIDEVPTHALTLTIPVLMRGKYIFCMVPAWTKTWAVYHTINDPVSETIPATCLRKHENAVLYTDIESAKMLCFENQEL
ncbi:MAG: glucosamine-6-phosphate deaminase [Dysgonamonadaceae bacterium]|jgi:glucosamine-6-phosphate deaminase|nr:glucosamine-6-phosphate deaminase [Dysgonamonadaceae bacterium]